MRTWAEIKYRLRQEASNLHLLLSQPQFSGDVPNRLSLPDPHQAVAALRGSLFEFTVLASAQSIVSHRFPLLGTTLETGPNVQWRHDYAHHKTSPANYFRLVPYLNFEEVGDHKFIWELNRHQHLVLLAQAYLFNGKQEYLDEIFSQLESWLEQNPFQRGINWASALEVGFRALSWIWLWYLCSEAMPPELRARFLTSLYQHGLHLERNLSVYFSPNTHLLGEAVALFALGSLFPVFPGADAWAARGAEVVEQQLSFQVKGDGSHFEQSTYYHVYALDLFLFYYLLADRPSEMEPALARMAEYLHWLLGPQRRIAYFGDDDGGRLFHPHGKRDEFGRATLATCGIVLKREEWLGTRDDVAEQALWWLGTSILTQVSSAPTPPSSSKLFPDAGTIFLQSSDIYLQFDAGPFGWGGAGHSHADTLSLVAWFRGEPLFTDPGTYTYMSDPKERDRFRGTRAHNTVTIDGQQQATTAGPFRWNDKPSVELRSFQANPDGGSFDAICEYRGFRHRRRIHLQGDQLTVLDEISGPPGEHLIEQVWNLGPAAGQVHATFSETPAQTAAESSTAYGVKFPSQQTMVSRKVQLPYEIAMRVESRPKAPVTLDDARNLFDNEVSRHLL